MAAGHISPCKVYAEKPCDNTHELDLDLGAEDGLKAPFDVTK